MAELQFLGCGLALKRRFVQQTNPVSFRTSSSSSILRLIVAMHARGALQLSVDRRTERRSGISLSPSEGERGPFLRLAFMIPIPVTIYSLDQALCLSDHKRTVHQEERLLWHSREKPLRTGRIRIGEVKSPEQARQILPIDVAIDGAAG